MQNEIDDVRIDIKKYFDPQNKLEGERYALSESGLYYFTSERYKQSDPKRNWVICKIQIWDTEKNKIIFEYLTDADDSDYSSAWICKDKKEYLLLPEAFQGQSVFDAFSRKLYSFYSSEDTFIWVALYPSPDGNKIAVDGSYCACPSELRVYDIKNITELPYKIIYQELNFTNERGCVFEHWEDNNTIVVCRNQKDIVQIKL
jgi:hypothetical protein